MLKESDFRKYFEGIVSAEILIERIQSKGIERNIPETPYSNNTPRTTKIIYDEQFHDLKPKEFILRRSHLIKLCDDFLMERISAWDLEDIACILYACDGFIWGNTEEERKLMADIMFNFSSPEINFPLTKDYIKKVKGTLMR